MRVAIVGSRNFPKKKAVVDYVNTLHPKDIVVSGGAGGVDTWAEEAARARGLRVTVFYPEWEREGRSAGFARNAWIANYAERCVAFHYENSTGTQHTIDLFEQDGKEVEVRHAD